MNIKNKLGRAAGIAAAAVVICWLSLAGVASASAAQPATLTGCAFQTSNGHYVTAVGGGGRTTDVIHTDATQIQAWEKFSLVSLGGGVYAIETINGHFLTAVGGGGRITDVIHTDATQIQAWEKFSLIFLANGVYAIETINGHFLTAVDGGGRITDVIHSDATRILAWEKFTLTCGH
jgi:hypothetical protein